MAWWCRGPHAQTIWGSLLRPSLSVTVERQRWETPDRDFIDVDWLPGAPHTPILIVLHGLGGSSRSKYTVGMLAAAQRKGWRGVAVNFRSCSGEPNRLRRSYHGGETSDLTWIVQRITAGYPGSPIFCVGASLGGNILLKYLGEQGDALPPSVKAAVAVSTPFDLALSAHTLEHGFARIYMNGIVRDLKQKAFEKLKEYPDLVDPKALAAVRTLTQFDELVTAPVNGFRNADDYWSRSSSKGFLSKIRRPTLLINAKDDPFLPERALPLAAVSENRFLTAEFTSRGGHVGFLSGAWPGRPVCWAEDRAVRFLERYTEDHSDKI